MPNFRANSANVTLFFGDGENMSMFNGCKRDLQRSGMQKVTTWELGEDIVDISLVLSGEVLATW